MWFKFKCFGYYRLHTAVNYHIHSFPVDRTTFNKICFLARTRVFIIYILKIIIFIIMWR